MIEHLLAAQTLPFTVALGLMLVIALMEGVGALFGMALSSLVDSLLPDFDAPDFDIDADMDVDVDIDIEADVDVDVDTQIPVHGPNLDAPGDTVVSTAGLFTRILTWLCFGRVPALVLLIAFLTSFGLAGLIVQEAAVGIVGSYLPVSFATAAALAIGLPATRYVGLGLGRIMPKEETEAVSQQQFIGKVAIVLRGEATRDMPAEAKLTDRYGQTHYLLVEPDDAADALVAGQEVLIVKQVDNRYFAIENIHEALSRK